MSNDLFDYDAGLDELLTETTEQDGNASNPATQKDATNDAGLGLDEEIKVTRKRAPIAKLDENKLLSQAGIPRLRRKAKEKLKYKGKGHEFSYAAKLLTLYQLWLDDLYPRAKFADALSIVEKLGHSKRMQAMRKEWINEDKPKPRDTYEEETETTGAGGETVPTRDNDDRMDLDTDVARKDGAGGEGQQDSAPSNSGGTRSIFGDGTRTAARNTNSIFDDDDDEDLFVSDPNIASKPSNLAPDNATPDEDDLDALLAETEQDDSATNSRPGPSSLPSRPANNDDYDDDLEAMNEYGM